MKYKELKVTLYRIYLHFTYGINCVLLPPAKVMFVVWTLACVTVIPSYNAILLYKILIIVFGYCFYCGVADVVYASKKPRYDNYKVKILKKKILLQKKIYIMEKMPSKTLIERRRDAAEIYVLLHQQKIKLPIRDYYKVIEELIYAIDEKTTIAEQHAKSSNEATDEDTYCYHINKCIEALEWMEQFEKFGVYSEDALPSDNIKELKYNMPFRIEQLRSKDSLSNIDNMEGHDFEYFCADLLRKNGFVNVEVTQGSGDHGIDVLAEKDDITYAIQCKCYSSNIGNAAVQQAHTGKSLYHRDVAVVMTNQYFTQQAKEEAAALRVKLWDRDKLNELIEKSML